MGRAGANLSESQGMTPAVPPPLRQGQPEEDNGREDESPHCSSVDFWVGERKELLRAVNICHERVRRCGTREAGTFGSRQREGQAGRQPSKGSQ